MGLGCCTQRCRPSSGLGSLWALAPPPSLHPHVLRDSSCPSLPFSWAYTAPLQKAKQVFCLNPTAWSTGNQQLLC